MSQALIARLNQLEKRIQHLEVLVDLTRETQNKQLAVEVKPSPAPAAEPKRSILSRGK